MAEVGWNPVTRPAVAFAARLALLALAVLPAVTARGTPGAAGSAPALPFAAARRLQQYPFPKNAFDRTPPYGSAKGKQASGKPEPVPGLVTPDRPILSNKSSSMEDLVLSRGYPLETYPVETPDGYVLRLYRIPYGVKNSTKPGPKPVVLLHHGVTLASSSFVVLDPGSSMGFYLADAGFDVWMVNTRGNTYSKGQRYFKHESNDYWQHSIDELALIDLPTQIDYVLKFTMQSSLALIGHSQGCTLAVALLAAKPEYNDKVWLLVLLGPVTFAEYVKSPYLAKAAEFGSTKIMLRAGAGKFIPNQVTSQMTSGCVEGAPLEYCADLINFLFYGKSKYTSPDDTQLIASTWPSTVAFRNLYHWSQMYHARRGLQMYDFGTNCSGEIGANEPYQESCNQAKYGQEDPPIYNLGNIRSKAAVFRGDWDVMATKEDVDKLVASWSANVVFDYSFPETAHMDVVWARSPMIKPDLIKILWANAPDVRKNHKTY